MLLRCHVQLIQLITVAVAGASVTPHHNNSVVIATTYLVRAVSHYQPQPRNWALLENHGICLGSSVKEEKFETSSITQIGVA